MNFGNSSASAYLCVVCFSLQSCHFCRGEERRDGATLRWERVLILSECAAYGCVSCAGLSCCQIWSWGVRFWLKQVSKGAALLIGAQQWRQQQKKQGLKSQPVAPSLSALRLSRSQKPLGPGCKDIQASSFIIAIALFAVSPRLLQVSIGEESGWRVLDATRVVELKDEFKMGGFGISTLAAPSLIDNSVCINDGKLRLDNGKHMTAALQQLHDEFLESKANCNGEAPALQLQSSCFACSCCADAVLAVQRSGHVAVCWKPWSKAIRMGGMLYHASFPELNSTVHSRHPLRLCVLRRRAS